MIFLSENKNTQWVDSWIRTMSECILGKHKSGTTASESEKNITLRVPKGVLIIIPQKKLDDNTLKFLLAAIFEGNSIVLVDDSESTSIPVALAKLFPMGVLNICAGVDEISVIVSGRQDVHIFVGTEEVNPVFTRLVVQDYSYSEIGTESWVNKISKVTYIKNIWN